ncbi:MAG: protein translocase subunit SecF [Erysipelotrichaceae bacterium]
MKTKYFDNKLKLFIGVDDSSVPDINSHNHVADVPFKKVNFVKNRKWFYLGSITVLIIGLISLCMNGLNLGIDFKGGSSITLNSDKVVSEKQLNKDFSELKLNAYDITFATDNNIVINVSDTLSRTQIAKVSTYFENKYAAKTDIGVVSNVVKNELIKNATLAVILASLAIILYISFRFTFKYAVAAIISLAHDVFMIIAMFSLFKIEVSSIFIAAILSIIGYSINDTIVTFDRIRENIKLKHKNKLKDASELSEVINISLRQTLVRSIITTLTTLIPVVSLILLGSHEIINFNLALLFGLVTGVYSSIFIAAQLWFDFNKKNVSHTTKKKWYEEKLNEKDELTVSGINA